MFNLKKILFIVNSLGQGGAERVVVNLANEMVKVHDVSIITMYDEKVYELNQAITFHTLGFSGQKMDKIFKLGKLRKQLSTLLSELEKTAPFDLITVHLPFAELVAQNSHFSDRCHFVVHDVHARRIKENSTLSMVKMTSYVKAFYKGKRIVTVSSGVKADFEDLFEVEAKSIINLPNPIDLALINEKKQEPLDVDYEYILGIGRFVDWKRFDLLIRSFAESKFAKNGKLVLIGDGPEKNNLTRLAQELGLVDKVVFAGWQDNPYQWMQHATCMVVTSKDENFAMTMIETLACNTKVLSVYSKYGPRDILKDELAEFLIKDATPAKIAFYIDEKLGNYPTDISQYVTACDIKNVTASYLALK